MPRTGPTRRHILRLAAVGLAAATPAWPQITDLEGFDPIWRDAESAIDAFFPRARFETEGLSLDMPQHVDSGASVPVTLRVDSAMTEADCPQVVHLLAHRNPSPHVLSVWFTPQGGRAEVSTRIRLEVSQTVTAVARMRDGRHLRTDRMVGVGLGACGQVGTGDNDDVFAFRPQTRISVPPVARRGDVVPVRGLISHPMETGMRYSDTHEPIRQRIVSRFRCHYGGIRVFHARLYPAVATNPYFGFFVRAAESGEIELDWYDILDITFRAAAQIRVV